MKKYVDEYVYTYQSFVYIYMIYMIYIWYIYMIYMIYIWYKNDIYDIYIYMIYIYKYIDHDYLVQHVKKQTSLYLGWFTITTPIQDQGVMAGCLLEAEADSLSFETEISVRKKASNKLPVTGVSKNSGTPKWVVKIMENSIKWMIWGYPYFRKHPNLIQLEWSFVLSAL